MTKSGSRLGQRSDSKGMKISNRILIQIPNDEFHRLRPYLEFLELPHRFSLREPGRMVRCGYFLNCGLASIVVSTRDGKDVEAGVVGCEGFVGTAILAGLQRSPMREQMQIAGTGFRVEAGRFTEVLEQSPNLKLSLTRYAILHGMQVAQTAACNRLHEVRERLARWLLLAQDRLSTVIVPITHDFLATMLGTDRSSVTLAAGSLQRKKIIECDRGVVKVANRERLERAACECYGVIRRFDGYLGLG